MKYEHPISGMSEITSCRALNSATIDSAQAITHSRNEYGVYSVAKTSNQASSECFMHSAEQNSFIKIVAPCRTY